IHRLLHLSALSVENAVELGFLCSAVYDTGNWPSKPESARRPREVDVLQLSSWAGFTEFNSVALERLKRSSPTGAISKAYTTQLLASAFRSSFRDRDHPHNWFDRIKWLLGEDWDVTMLVAESLECGYGEHYEFVVPTTPF